MALIQTTTISFPAAPFASRRRTSAPFLPVLRLSSSSSFPSFPYPFSQPLQNPKPPFQPNPLPEAEDDDDVIIGDCLVFEEGAFEQPVDSFTDLKPNSTKESTDRRKKTKKKKQPVVSEPEPQDLVPDKWKQAVEEINMTKKERRKIAYELKFGTRVERRKPPPLPDIEEYRAYREMNLPQFKPVVVDEPKQFAPEKVEEMVPPEPGSRVAPKNPRLEIGGGTLDDISDFFGSRDYVPMDKDSDSKPGGRQKLFTNEEKALLNRRVPDLSVAVSRKWLPLHILAASGEFYLLDKILRYTVDINAVDKDGLTAIHRAILCKKQAIVNYLLRNSANPFIRDNEGATLMHYAVHTASSETIKILLLYNVDINLSDHDGWTPLHLAVQAQRTDIVKLLLIKGADQSIKNNDGLTPLQLCLYSGHNVRIFELIKLLKGFPLVKKSPSS
ncbi:Ankyrin repeat protein [Rhynchospora pubera]|uniref:Ankyrin repeat protein n=1 Tax=Rhynchospora pubera TaxID=906938 RepID=A0AAV8GKP0_9POAL|nr:Ankyrin repeat protein [Rhynchospora pubera]